MYKHAIIILGCGINERGELGEDAEQSVRLGITQYEQLGDACIIMTGNVSYKATFTPSISEAQAMKEYAVTLGVPGNKIFVETESKDSLSNLFFTKQNLLITLGINNCVIVRGPNQSTERIEYLAYKVLGDSYTFTIIEPATQRPSEREREQKSLAVAKQWLDNIPAGDTDAIYKIMRSKHPGYNSSLTLDGLKQLL